MQSAMESRFSHRFNTNYVPSDEEIECIRTDLVSHTQELARIDERIRELSAQRDQIQAYIGSHKALISHPRRLPVDILREIFVACLPVDRNAVMSAQEAPLLLGRICSVWRSIVLTTRRLWASLHASFEYIVAKSSRAPAVAEWLGRSVACPISLSLSDLRWDDGSPDRLALLKSLIDFGNRWRHVEFIGLSTAKASELAGIRAPALESLRFTGNVTLLRDLDFIKVPTLRTVALESHNDNFKLDLVLAMPFVWGRLTHLTLKCYEGFSVSNAVVLLGRCARLVSFQFSLKEPDTEIVDTISGPISLPFLTTLIMTEGFLKSQSLSHLIEHVSMPQLHQFDVASLSVPDCSFMVDIGKGSPLLEEFGDFCLRWLSAESFLVGLRSLPSLAKLVVSAGLDEWAPYSFSSAQLLKLLTPGPSETTICPALQELVMRGCPDLEEETLDAFIRGRAEFTRGFRRLELRNPTHPDIVPKDQIHSYLSQGVDVLIVHDDGMKPLSPWTGLPT
ncbi:hypothetical protein B0H14DRAFT_3145881 [Mycena olivaceomarginata]|nr:hypothetical protein B0H14DRAFT_3145881 [Mycena olivaceomarginata]